MGTKSFIKGSRGVSSFEKVRSCYAFIVDLGGLLDWTAQSEFCRP